MGNVSDRKIVTTVPRSAYMKLGINHHLLFPDSLVSQEAHYASLPEVLSMDEFEIVDMLIPGYANPYEDRIVAAVLQSGKEVIYNFPLLGSAGLNPHHPDADMRLRALDYARMHVERARRLGAGKIVVASGANPEPDQRGAQREWFVEYVAQICRFAGEETGIVIEPFDQSIGKNLLVGSTVQSVDIVGEIRREGLNNIGLLIDMGHVPLLRETFRHALETSRGTVGHIHLGSCYMRDSNDPMYGDMHPPWGYAGGANDVEEAAQFIGLLWETGYLGEGKRPSVTLEMRPYAETSERESVNIFLEKLGTAWKLAMGERYLH